VLNLFKKSMFSLVFLGIAGCGFAGLGDAYTAKKELSKSFTTKPKPNVVVETFNGKVEVIARPSEGKVEVKLVSHAGGTSQEAAEENLEDIATSVEMDGDTVRVKAELTSEAFLTGNRGAEVELQVPMGTILDLNTSNGKISATGAAGKTTARTSNGGISVMGSQGDVALRSSNGGLSAESVKGTIQLETSNGKIDIVSSDGVVKAHTSNGAVRFKGTAVQGQYSFRTSNGSIELILPSDTSFQLDATTSNGGIDTDFPIQKSSEDSERTRLSGTVGKNPTVTITAHTSNGRIKVMQEKQ
jgi:DUF4097 and DUF4098 domain-containing protein YvlB